MTLENMVVVGAGPAGLCAAWSARREGWEPLVIDRAAAVGGAWRSMPPETRCLSPRRYDRLPDGTIPSGSGERATAAEVLEAVTRFAERERFQIEHGPVATGLSARAGRLRVETSAGPLETRRLVVATGEYTCPRTPALPGRFDGRVLHSCELHRAAPIGTQRVVVVGAGNSGTEIAVRLAGQGARVTIAAPGGVHDPGPWRGPLAQSVRWWISAAPIRHLPWAGGCREQTPVVDRALFEAVEAGAVRAVGRVVALDPAGVRVQTGELIGCEVVIFATGFHRETAWLGDAVSRTRTGRPWERGGLSPEVPGLGFVGIPCMRTRRSGFLRGFAGDAVAVVGGLR